MIKIEIYYTVLCLPSTFSGNIRLQSIQSNQSNISAIETTTTTETYDPESNRDILTAEDMARIEECKGNLATLNYKLGNVNAHIEHFRTQIKTLYAASPYLIYTADSTKMMTLEDWKQKFEKLTAKRGAFTLAKRDYRRKLEPLQKQLMEKMADVKEKAKLRDKQPNYDNPGINRIKAKITELETTNPAANKLSDDESTFLCRCSTYQEYRDEFYRVIGHNEDAIKKKLTTACFHVSRLETAILEDTWLGKYLVYARLHGLNVDPDTLFEDCNRHYLDSHTVGHMFDCPCESFVDSEDEDLIVTSNGYDYGCGHIWSGGGRCSYGTKMYLEYSVRIPFGLIENSDPLGYCHLYRS